MDRKQIIGFVLIFALIVLYTWYNKPSEADRLMEQRIQDSIAIAAKADTVAVNQRFERENTRGIPVVSDSLIGLQKKSIFGGFYASSDGLEQEYVLENELLKLTFTNKGGRIKSALLKKHFKIEEGPKHEELKRDLFLLDNPKAKFDFLLPVQSAKYGMVNTGDLFFDAAQQGNSISFKIISESGAVFQQIYTLSEDDYTVDYSVKTDKLDLLIDRDTEKIELKWVDFLDKLEKNDKFEKTYATLQYKIYDGDTDYCSYTKDDTDDMLAEKIEWVSNSNQFFSSVLMAKEGSFFQGGQFSTHVAEDDEDYLKKCTSRIFIPLSGNNSDQFDMTFYIGPNDFDKLKSFGNDLEESVNFGRSIFGTLNRWVIRPIFLFFLHWTNSAGVAIILLILLVKTVLYPLTYKMLKSNAKMGVLKPEIAKIKEKNKDDSQKTQVETMALYRKFGVSPFGGCMPMIAQMPIWFALFRFFPAALEFRQKPFLWATDLSSYDALFHLPFEIPMFGSHLSLFALLWTISTLLYTYYNTQNMDMGSNPAMKYMQYFMPVIFIVFFNNYASGLTAYMFFSNMINVIQTIVTKNYIFDDQKIRAELELKKDKPKKKNSFSKRLEEAMKQQQKTLDEKNKKGKKK